MHEFSFHSLYLGVLLQTSIHKSQHHVPFSPATCSFIPEQRCELKREENEACHPSARRRFCYFFLASVLDIPGGGRRRQYNRADRQGIDRLTVKTDRRQK